MGNSHSQYHQKRRNSYLPPSSSCNLPNTVTANSSIITPPMSTKSSPASRNNSRPSSVTGDVKYAVQKMIKRSSSTLDVVANTMDQSVASSLRRPSGLSEISVGGRTYLNNKYCFPIDEEEQDRLTNIHFVLKHCFGDNISAPVSDLLSVAHDNNTMNNSPLHSNHVPGYPSPALQSNWSKQQYDTPAQVLDVACGSGVWVLEMATMFPRAEFYGIDCASIYPNAIKPINTNFTQGDILAGFPYPDEYFDYVHMRLVYNCFSPDDLKFVLSEINRVLKPGGYIELRDMDPVMKNTGPTADKLFLDFVNRMKELYSVDVSWTKSMCQVLMNQGTFTDIHHQEVSVGYGVEGPLATSFDCSIRDCLKSYKKYFMDAYDITQEASEALIDQIIEESAGQRVYTNYYMAWGRKPLVSEQLMTTSPLLPLHDSPILMRENAFDIVHFANGFTE